MDELLKTSSWNKKWKANSVGSSKSHSLGHTRGKLSMIICFSFNKCLFLMGNFNPDGSSHSYLLFIISLLMQTGYPSLLAIHWLWLIPGKWVGHQGLLTIDSSNSELRYIESIIYSGDWMAKHFLLSFDALNLHMPTINGMPYFSF